jgi:bla regulator protein blaR1
MQNAQTVHRTLLLAAAGIVALGAVIALRAQVPDTKPPAFEVASVKPNKSLDGDRNFGLASGRFTATHATLRELVGFAYQLQDGRLRHDSQISGGPNWINSDHFDVVAKAEGDSFGFDASRIPAGAARPGEISAIDQVRLMLRTLLADRFKLTVHNEIRELPIYALVMARSDGTLGPQLRRVDLECVALRDDGRGSPPEPGKAICGGFRGLGPGGTTGHAVPISLLAKNVEGSVDRIVTDRTGLTGRFDVDLQWTPDQLRQFKGSPDLPPGTLPQINGFPFDPNGPSIFTALQEQLGLKLESTKGPVDVLVIDHVEQPTPD